MVDVAGKSTRGSDQIQAITTRLSIAVPDLSTGFAKDAGNGDSNSSPGAIYAGVVQRKDACYQAEAKL